MEEWQFLDQGSYVVQGVDSCAMFPWHVTTVEHKEPGIF